MIVNGKKVISIIRNGVEVRQIVRNGALLFNPVPAVPIARYSAKGKTNQDADRAVLKDLTGNGYDITLNNFAFSQMSGYGGYGTDFRNWSYSPASIMAKRTDSDVVLTKVPSASIGTGFKYGGTEAIKLRVKFDKAASIRVEHTPKIGSVIKSEVIANSDFFAELNLPALDTTLYTKREIFFTPNPTNSESLTVEQVPLYKDALVSDGINDFGACLAFPALQDYTIISKRVWLNDKVNEKGYFLRMGGSDSRLIHETVHTKNSYSFNTLYTKGAFTHSKFSPDLLSYQTLSIYNGEPLNVGTSDVQALGAALFSSKNTSSYAPSAIALSELHIFDRSLSEGEINHYILNNIDKYHHIQPKIHYDFSRQTNQSSNRTTMYDLSGNANNATLYNFAFSGMSGFGGFDGGNWNNRETLFPNNGNITFTDSKLTASLTSAGNVIAQYQPTDFFPKGVKVNCKVSGLTGGFSLAISNETTELYRFTANGTYEIKIDTDDARFFKLEGAGVITGVTFEQLPLYPDALLLDGVDDYLKSSKTANIKTIIMDWIPFEINRFAYDGRDPQNNGFGISVSAGLVWQAANQNGVTYIDGTKNTNISGASLLNKRHVASLCSTVPNTIAGHIGASRIPHLYSKMAIYKFLAFEEELTEEQVNHMIERYNLTRK